MTWLYDNWKDVVRVCTMALLAYPTVVLFLRVSGKRTLSKMNAFDLVITVAFGSTLASVMLSSDVSYTEGAAAFFMLVALQYVAAWTAARFDWMSKALKSTPTILLWNGEILIDVCKRERVEPKEVRAAIRQEGIADVSTVRAVVLESAGDLSVISQSGGDFTALQDATNEPGG